MNTITIKKNSKMKTIKLNKNGKARPSRKCTHSNVVLQFQPAFINRTATQNKADQIKYILDNVGYLYREELEEMLWKLTK